MNERLVSAVATGCGGELAAGSMDSILTSPGYPNNYTNSLDCRWTIRAVTDHQVAIRLTDVDIEGSPGRVTNSL